MTSDSEKLTIESLLGRSKWTDPTIDLYIGDIIEYDMNDGGYSIIKEKNLLPPQIMRKLDRMGKGPDRHKAIGNLRYNKNPNVKQIGQILESEFKYYRIAFGKENQLSATDILSIKRDAIFTKRYVDVTSFGNYVSFAEKHHYDIFIKIKKIELFYDKSTNRLDVKGITDDKVIRYHDEYLLKAVRKVLNRFITFDREKSIRYVVELIDDYKFLRLPVEYYREFNTGCGYQMNFGDQMVTLEEVGEEVKPSLDIRFNFNELLIPLLNLASTL